MYRENNMERSGCAASEEGAPFVARRAVNLHGCAPASRAPFPQIPAFKSGCAASEGRASFVARRAVNLHGCALPHCAPLLRRLRRTLLLRAPSVPYS